MSPQDRRRVSRAERFLFRLPAPVLESPFEVLVAVVASISGLGVTLRVLRPGSLDLLLPELPRELWGIALLVGAVTLSVGLVTRGVAPTTAALQLLGSLFAVYTIALIAYAGWAAAGAAAACFGTVSLLCFLRALYITTLAAVARRIARES